ncbi:dual specificity protein kinase kns1 [Dissophora globulifera]|nr:dual specificity protein kinase kns1 [Dissophora globulifera]
MPHHPISKALVSSAPRHHPETPSSNHGHDFIQDTAATLSLYQVATFGYLDSAAMTNSSTNVGRRQADWAEFYKNGPPQEVIVIDDDTPPPPSLSSSSSSSSSSVQHLPNGHLDPASPRYRVVQQMNSGNLYRHPAVSTSHASASSIPVATGRPRKPNKRLPSTELSASATNGVSHVTGQHYAYSQSSYASGHQDHGHPALVYSDTARTPRSELVHSLHGVALAPAKKKRRQNVEVKYVQPRAPQEAQAPYYPPAPPAHANAPAANRDAPVNIPPWDDKEGHYIVVANDDFTARYKIIKLLGQGTFGKVVECFDRETGRHCAIKIIRAVQKYRDASKIEARVLTTLKRHDPPNAYKCLHLNDCFDYRNHVCMVFDLLGQSIYDWLKDNFFCPFPPNQIQQFAFQLLRSVEFLHRLRLIHTDLKPENILLKNGAFRQAPFKKSPSKMRRILLDPEIRLIDFGSATFQDEHHSTVVSTRHYRAPEIILGCILVEFLTGEALFQTHDNLEHLAMMQAVLGPIPDKLIRTSHKTAQKYFVSGRLDYPNDETKRNSRKYVKALKPLKDYVVPASNRVENLNFAASLKDLLSQLLTYDPEKRISAAQALKHPYFSYIVDEGGMILGKKASEPLHPTR